MKEDCGSKEHYEPERKSVDEGFDEEGRTDDGKVDVKLTLPKEMGGSGASVAE